MTQNHGNFKHGNSKSRDFHYPSLMAWRNGILKKGNFKCRLTGTPSNGHGNLETHHLLGWGNKDHRYDLRNGVVLTQAVHTQFHQLYGFGNNTPEQFIEYAFNWYQIDLTGEIPTTKELLGNHDPSSQAILLENAANLLEFANTKKQVEFQKLLESRNHELVSGVYVNAHSRIVVRCLKHAIELETNVTNYKKSVTGMRCCGAVLQGEACARTNRLGSRRRLAAERKLSERRSRD